MAKTTTVAAFTGKRPARERVIVLGPAACLCCGGLVACTDWPVSSVNDASP